MSFKKISVYHAPKESPGYLLWHISTSWRKTMEEILKALDLTHPQFVVLASLGWLTKEGDSVTQSAVGKMANLDPNTTSQIIKGLEKRGLIQRGQSPDGRAKNPFLTPKGNKLLHLALPAVEKADAEFFAPLQSKEMATLIKIFQQLTEGNS